MIRSNAITIDVEDGVSIAMRDYFGVTMDPTERVLVNTGKILDLFEKHQIRGTFFIQGEIAKHYPELIKKIAAKNHELGVHSYSHRKYFLLNKEELRHEVVYTKKLIEDISGKEVFGHRAPAFSINASNSWALNVISDAGFVYDSSIFPAKAINYGWPGISKHIHRLDLDNGNSIIEAPLTVMNILGKPIPVGGGGYLRHFPYIFTRSAIKNIEKDRPVIVYLHPYEIDTVKYPDFFFKSKAQAGLSKRIQVSFFRLNKGTVYQKLNMLLSEHRFAPLMDVVNSTNFVVKSE